MIERYLDRQLRDSNKIRLTVNPNTGRVTLKTPMETDSDTNQQLSELVNVAMTYDFPPQTFRGVVDIHNGKCYVDMFSDNKALKVTLHTELHNHGTIK